MIALDTNIVVRYLVEPDGDEGALAAQLIDVLTPEKPGFLSAVVVAELLWVLGLRYAVSQEDQRAIVARLLEMPQLVIESAAALERALTSPHRGLADCFLHEIGQSAGCVRAVTFDRRFARLERVELLQ